MSDDGPDDALVVERPEVLEAAAAAGEDRQLRGVVLAALGAALLDPALEAAERATTMLAGASSPWTWHATRTTRVSGQRRARTWPMSRQTTPVGLVTTAIVVGRCGSGRLRAWSNRPSWVELRLERLEAQREVAEPGRLDRLDVELERALRLEEVDPAVDDDPEPGLRLERRSDALVAEPDALERAAVVLEAEVRVPGRADRHPADLALDPDVPQPVVGPDGLADGPRDLADAEDLQPERAGRRARRRRRGAGVGQGRGVVGGVPSGEQSVGPRVRR